MQKSMFFVLILFLLFSNCATLEFEKPIPYQATVMDKVPEALIGDYLEQDKDDKPKLLQEVIRFEAPTTELLLVYEYFMFTNADLKHYPNYELQNDTLIEHIELKETGAQTKRDSTHKIAVQATKNGFQTSKILTYRIDFKTKEVINYGEAMDTIEKLGAFEMRKKGDSYYLNIQDGNKDFNYWYVILLKPSQSHLTINFLSHLDHKQLEDVEKIMPLTKVDEATYLAKPSESQLKAYLKHPGVGEETILKRLNH